jgi:hypothetical protein
VGSSWGSGVITRNLSRFRSRSYPPLPYPELTLTFESSRTFGEVWALTERWNALGFSAVRDVFGKTRHRIEVEALLRVMIFNR